MYIFTAQELKQIHEERVGVLINHNTPSQKQKTNQKPRSWSLKSILSAMMLKLT